MILRYDSSQALQVLIVKQVFCYSDARAALQLVAVQRKDL